VLSKKSIWKQKGATYASDADVSCLLQPQLEDLAPTVNANDRTAAPIISWVLPLERLSWIIRTGVGRGYKALRSQVIVLLRRPLAD
jgi:hypothetical protein